MHFCTPDSPVSIYIYHDISPVSMSRSWSPYSVLTCSSTRRQCQSGRLLSWTRKIICWWVFSHRIWCGWSLTISQNDTDSCNSKKDFCQVSYVQHFIRWQTRRLTCEGWPCLLDRLQSSTAQRSPLKTIQVDKSEHKTWKSRVSSTTSTHLDFCLQELTSSKWVAVRMEN